MEIQFRVKGEATMPALQSVTQAFCFLCFKGFAKSRSSLVHLAGNPNTFLNYRVFLNSYNIFDRGIFTGPILDWVVKRSG